MNNDTNPSTTSDSSQSSLKEAFINILGEILESCIHELLYNRHVYPREAFVPTRYMGIRCHGCRVPAVVDYIVDALMVAVPSIISGSVDCLSLIIFDSNKENTRLETVLEKYNFEFDPREISTSPLVTSSPSHPGNNTVIKTPPPSSTGTNSNDLKSPSATTAFSIPKTMQELEWGLKQLLLRIITLEGHSIRSQPLPPTATFKICMRTSKNVVGSPIVTPSELEQALTEGKWFEPDVETCMIASKKPEIEDFAADINTDSMSDKQRTNEDDVLIRPLKSVNVVDCGLKLQLSMETQNPK